MPFQKIVFVICGLAALLAFPLMLAVRSTRTPSIGDPAPPVSTEPTGATANPSFRDGHRYLLFVDSECPACGSHLDLLTTIIDSLDTSERRQIESRIQVIERGEEPANHPPSFALEVAHDHQGKSLGAFGVTVFPTGFLISDGMILGAHHGTISAERTDAVIRWLSGSLHALDDAVGGSRSSKAADSNGPPQPTGGRP